MPHYTLTPLPQRHQWQICLQFDHDTDTPQTIKLANWTPGSYMIRDFCRHIMSIRAECGGRPVPLEQSAKNIWHTPAQRGRYRIFYTVYANDLSVRAAYLDGTRGFISGAAVFLYLPEQQHLPHETVFDGLPGHWQIATALTRTGQNRFQAASYAELIDSPFELGAAIETLEFSANGIPHRIALSGVYSDFDRTRLIEDSRRICESALNLFPAPAPFEHYLFLLHLGDNIYGGLEHRSSTALHADRHSLPPHGTDAPGEAYTRLLGLISHEYFHAWNVKSIRPAAFDPYDLDRENYTEQLWAFEGITSYYDDLLLARSRTVSPESYLVLLADTLAAVRQNGGRRLQTLAQSSFSAWDKYYKQDENSPNAITSYYRHGALAALCLDLHIRAHSPHSLDTVMQALYRHSVQHRRGISRIQWQQIAEEAVGLDLQDFFQAALHTTQELPLEGSLKTAGLELRWLPQTRNGGRIVSEFPEHAAPAPDLGCRFKQQDGRARLTQVFNGGAAENAGLMPQDDIIAVDGLACTDFAAQTATRPDDTHTLHYFRHGVLAQTEITVHSAPAHTPFIRIADRNALLHWLYGG